MDDPGVPNFNALPPDIHLANAEVSVKKPARANTKKASLDAAALIATDDDLRTGVKALRRKCAHMRAAHDLAGYPPLRRRPGGFDGIVRIINGQQLSVASAAAIYGRVAATIKPLTAKKLLAAPDETLRGCGLSRPKIKTLRAVAEAVVGGLDLDALATLPEAEAIAQLTAVSGIGPWTADIYLMFCVGRRDVFASGDLALQIAAQMVMGLKARPTAREMAEIAERWSPWRTVAAGLLWAYYAEAKKKGLAVPV
jgi:DNA-3-methyladenine glycosylase II